MRVTVGIPFLNASRTLGEAIRSVFAQTLDDWELILVDDGSTDESLDIAMAVDDPRVRVLSDGENRGLQMRLNEIARLARGDLLSRMDADDIMHPERLARQADYLASNPSCDIVGTATYVIDGDGRPIGIRHVEPLDASAGNVLRSGFICHPTSTARSDWSRRNLYDETFVTAEDHELYCRIAPTSGLARLSTPLFYYRETHKDPGSYYRYYRSHARGLRRCYSLYGPSTVGWPGTAKLIIRSHIKTGIYTLATLMGIQEAIIRRRSGRPLEEDELREALDGLERVRRVHVPGID